MTPTIMIMAGGTGGHVFPGLAVAAYLKEMGWKIIWLGTKNGMEASLVPKHGIEIEWIRFSGLRGKGLLRWVMLPISILYACGQSISIISKRKPSVVIGMGGFVSFPGGLIASLLNRPLVIHEQNSIAGLANRVLARIADQVLTAFPKVFPSSVKASLTGNPIRKEMTITPEPKLRFANRSGPLKILVVGGSLGARALNQIMPQVISSLPQVSRPRVTHQAGNKHFDALQEVYRSAGVEVELLPFIDNMAERYAECDLIICRSGALTVAEIAAIGVASVLIPFPYAVDDHQTHNARFLSEVGAAEMIQESQLTAKKLVDLLRGLTREKLLHMAEAARKLGQPEATRKVAEVCIGLAK